MDTQTNKQTGMPSKLSEQKHLFTDQTGTKNTYCQDESGKRKTYCQDESGNYGKTIWQYRSPSVHGLSLVA